MTTLDAVAGGAALPPPPPPPQADNGNMAMLNATMVTNGFFMMTILRVYFVSLFKVRPALQRNKPYSAKQQNVHIIEIYFSVRLRRTADVWSNIAVSQIESCGVSEPLGNLQCL